MPAPEDELAQAGFNLLSVLVREGQNLSHIVELTEGKGLGHFNSLGDGLQLS